MFPLDVVPRSVFAPPRPDVTQPSPKPPLARRIARTVLRSPQLGLLLVLFALATALTMAAGSHVDPQSGRTINNFLNQYTLIQMATDASAFAIMGVGATLVIIAGGIDLSVGAIYALSGVAMAMVLRAAGPMSPALTVLLGLGTCLTVSLLAGLANGTMVVGLGVHPFIITLGTMWILRGIAFVVSRAESILVPTALTAVAKAPLGLGAALYPVPLLSCSPSPRRGASTCRARSWDAMCSRSAATPRRAASPG